MIARKLLFCLGLWIVGSTGNLFAAQSSMPEEAASSERDELRYPQLVQRFYSIVGSPLFWLNSGDDFAQKRKTLIQCIAGADSLGLSAADYHPEDLKRLEDVPGGSNEEILLADRRLTDAAITFCKDLYGGRDMPKWISYDGISSRYTEADNNYILEMLSRVKSASDLTALVQQLQPACEGYNTLTKALKIGIIEKNNLQVKQLASSLNYYRWIRHFHLDSFIVINIAAATLDYYRGDSLIMSMRAVLGKPETRTPRFAAYLKEVTLYPYWNMPRSILVKEWLPSVRKNPSLINFLSMEIIDKRGRIVSPSAINWRTVSSANFPYRLRQKTGCLNPLGVVKFTLTSPYDVYLHDTNFKGAFLSGNRYYSHGCIRLQDPVGLADAVLINKVDTGFLQACFKNQAPQVLPVSPPVAVFVVYMPAEPGEAGSVRYFKDIYKLLK